MQTSEPNLFVTSLPTTRNMHRQGPRIKGKRKPMKSKPVIRVGGRKVSAALKNNTRYRFAVEVSHIGDINQQCPFRAGEGLLPLFPPNSKDLTIFSPNGMMYI